MIKNEEGNILVGVIVAIIILLFMIFVPISWSYDEVCKEDTSTGRQILFVILFIIFIMLTISICLGALGMFVIFDKNW